MFNIIICFKKYNNMSIMYIPTYYICVYLSTFLNFVFCYSGSALNRIPKRQNARNRAYSVEIIINSFIDRYRVCGVYGR